MTVTLTKQVEKLRKLLAKGSHLLVLTAPSDRRRQPKRPSGLAPRD